MAGTSSRIKSGTYWLVGGEGGGGALLCSKRRYVRSLTIQYSSTPSFMARRKASAVSLEVIVIVYPVYRRDALVRIEWISLEHPLGGEEDPCGNI